MGAASLEEISDIAILAGEIMLKNGAETSRVEQTMEHMALASGACSVQSFVIHTGVFVTMSDYNGRSLTTMRRVRDRTINLDRIAKVNELSRQLTSKRMGYQDTFAILKRIGRERTGFSWRPSMLASGVLGGGFAVLQNGGIGEVAWAFAAAAIVRFIAHVVSRLHGVRFTYEFIGSMTAGLIGVMASNWWPGLSRDIIIVGGILPLVPGVAITNAISDIIAGNLLSGISRGLEAALTSIAVAMGVFIILAVQIW